MEVEFVAAQKDIQESVQSIKENMSPSKFNRENKLKTQDPLGLDKKPTSLATVEVISKNENFSAVVNITENVASSVTETCNVTVHANANAIAAVEIAQMADEVIKLSDESVIGQSKEDVDADKAKVVVQPKTDTEASNEPAKEAVVDKATIFDIQRMEGEGGRIPEPVPCQLEEKFEKSAETTKSSMEQDICVFSSEFEVKQQEDGLINSTNLKAIEVKDATQPQEPLTETQPISDHASSSTEKLNESQSQSLASPEKVIDESASKSEDQLKDQIDEEAVAPNAVEVSASKIELEEATLQDLKEMAKKAGIKANLKRELLIDALQKFQDTGIVDSKFCKSSPQKRDSTSISSSQQEDSDHDVGTASPISKRSRTQE